MATATIATAAGMAVLFYFIFTRKLLLSEEARAAAEGGDNPSKAVKRRVSRRLAQAPATWREAVATLAETLRFTYSETLGKWPIGDLAFGIRYLMRQQGNVQVESVYAGSNCVELKGDGIVDELIRLLRLLNLCMLFSKKPFPVFLESAGYSQDDVLLQEPKAGLLKPAFTIIRDKSSKCLLLLIRGTHSVKDTLTAVTGGVVPFHHSIVSDGGISELVLGYAHCGMVAAAHWIAKCTTPCLLKAVAEYSDYNIEIVGHSLGGGTAALLTYILRERKEFSPSTCVAFAPAACMTWDLAESGKHFITTVINGSDLVPTFSTASIDNLRSEVTASSWLNDLREQVQNTKILNVVYRSAYALGSRLPSISNARARVAGAGAILRPVSSKTQVVMRSAQTVAQAVARNRPTFSSWSCMGARRRAIAVYTSPIGDDSPDPSCNASSKDSDSFMIESINSETLVDELESACSGESDHEEIEEEEHMGRETAKEEEMTEGELWFKLQKEHHTDGGINLQEANNSLNEIAEEENMFLPEASKDEQPALSDGLEIQQFYPPGRIMHMVAIPSSVTCPGEDGNTNEYFGIYETPRDLYNKIRLSSTMINDHYMPMYKQMMERLIDKLKEEDNDDDCIGTLL